MSAIFEFDRQGAVDSKMHISQGSLPPYIDASQPPTKKSPWRQIKELPFVHTVTMLMPDEMHELVWNKIDADLKKVEYAKVIMKLQEVLEGDFFTDYIKKGNVLMLSEGRPGVDNKFSLQDGVLRLDLDKESYERAGLQGRPIRSGGRKHIKARYVVEVDLRQRSMLHGKKGFERVVWAAKNVLNVPLLWLFADVSKPKPAPASSLPLNKYHPTCLELLPIMHMRKNVVVHNALVALTEGKRDKPMAEDEEEYHELMEWIDKVILGSAEVVEESVRGNSGASAPRSTLRYLTVQGLVSPDWITRTLISIISLSRSSESPGWLVMAATSHSTEAFDQSEGYTIILTPSQPSRQEDKNGAEVSVQFSSSETQKSWENSGLENFLVLQMADTLDA